MKFPKVSPEIAHTFEKSLCGATKGNTVACRQAICICTFSTAFIWDPRGRDPCPPPPPDALYLTDGTLFEVSLALPLTSSWWSLLTAPQAPCAM